METKALKQTIVKSIISGLFAWFIINLVIFLLRYNAVKNENNLQINFEKGRFWINENLTGYDFWPSVLILSVLSFGLLVLTRKRKTENEVL